METQVESNVRTTKEGFPTSIKTRVVRRKNFKTNDTNEYLAELKELDLGYDCIKNTDIKTPNDPLLFYISHKFQCDVCDEKWDSPLKSSRDGMPCPKNCNKGIKHQSIGTSIGRTPYQSNYDATTGLFSCHRCEYEWESYFAYKDYYQQCMFCKIICYPYYQEEHEQKSLAGPKHKHGLCQYCLTDSTGRGCSTEKDQAKFEKMLKNRSHQFRRKMKKRGGIFDDKGNVMLPEE